MASIYKRLNAYPLSDTFESIAAFKRKARCAARLRAPAAQLPEAIVQWPQSFRAKYNSKRALPGKALAFLCAW